MYRPFIKTIIIIAVFCTEQNLYGNGKIKPRRADERL